MFFFKIVLKFLARVVIIAFAVMIFSCEEFCEIPDRTAIVVNFYSLETDDIEAIYISNLQAIGNDSVLHKDVTLSQVLLPINPASDEMSFSIQKGELPADVVIFRYTRHAGFISAECGCATFAEINEIIVEGEEPSIIHIEITDPNAKTVSYRHGVVNAENIKIYY